MKEGRLGPIERFAFTMLLPLSIFACRLNQDTQTSAADSVAAELSSGEGAATASVAVSGTYPAAAQSAARQERSRTWSFDDMPAGVAPPGFSFARTGNGAQARWLVQAALYAYSGANVLVQTDTDATSNRFPVAVADEPRLRDLMISVRCKTVSGHVDQACGLVFRYLNADNYYLTRSNSREDNIRLYYVKDGRRREIASWAGEVTRDVWHELRAEARGEELRVFWDGRQVVQKQDRTFPAAGRAGLWTKADSYTLFDDLTVIPLKVQP